MVPGSLAKLEDEQEGECTEYGACLGPGTREVSSLIVGQLAYFFHSEPQVRILQNSDIVVADALANIEATSFGHACLFFEFPGGVQPSTLT